MTAGGPDGGGGGVNLLKQGQIRDSDIEQFFTLLMKLLCSKL